MMFGRSTLRARLILSFIALVAVVTVAGFVTVQVLVPQFFEQGIQQRMGPGGSGQQQGNGAQGNPNAPGRATQSSPTSNTMTQSSVAPEIQQAYDSALTSALFVATAIGLLIAIGLGVFFTRRLLRTFTGVKEGARRLAEGHYTVEVPTPREAELADLAESVNTLAASLQRTEETRARLVSDLAHELRNPLSTIEGYMEGLIDGVIPASDDTYAAVAHEAHRLKKLTHDLSTLSKAREGAIELSMTDSDLGGIVARVVDRLRPQFELNDVALDVAIAKPLPVRADPDRLGQAVTNLLGNALAHTPPGGSVRVNGRTSGDSCIVAFNDTGSGIPEAQLDAIFERFTRLDRDQPGTGIGLNIARTLARAHGGEIEAASPGPDEGATFTLTLPRRR
jgi:signal transduction histidine kinase